MAENKTAEEIAAATKATEDAQIAAAEAAGAAAIDPLLKANELIGKLTDERDNYKNVALKRLGKLPGDADYLETADKTTGLTVSEQVRLALVEKEISAADKVKDDLIRGQAKTISELTRSLNNRPPASIGGGSGEPLTVKDNTFTDAQIAAIRAKGERLKVKDMDAFIEKAKKNLLNTR